MTANTGRNKPGSGTIFRDTALYPKDGDRARFVNTMMTLAKGDYKNIGRVRKYATMLWEVARVYKMSATVLGAQFMHETAAGTSDHWIRDHNPAGIGIWGDGAKTPWRYDGTEDPDEVAAAIHVIEMHRRSVNFTLPSTAPSSRISRVISEAVAADINHLVSVSSLFNKHPGARTHNIASLNVRFGGDQCTWACDPNYASKIDRWVTLMQSPIPPQEAEGRKMEYLRPAVLLIAGHRQTVSGGGTPGESVRTPLLVNAYRRALESIGVAVHHLQAEDGDSDPDDVVGGLDVASNKARELGAELIKKHSFVVILDLHFEGSAPSVRGLFAIYPRSNGLTTAAPVGNQNADAQGENAWDQAFGLKLSQNLSKFTGIPLRMSGVVAPGLMGEHQTGVGGQGYRLATFAYTAPLQNNAIRLVVEHGALTNGLDKAIIDGSSFYKNVEAAVRDTFVASFDFENPSGSAPSDPIPSGASVPETIGRVSNFNGATWYPLVARLEAGPSGGRAKKNGGSDSPVVYTYPAGSIVKVDWLVRGQGGVWYYVTRDRLRVPVSDFTVSYVIDKE